MLDTLMVWDTQEVESTNSVIRFLTARAPHISLELLSARLQLKKSIKPFGEGPTGKRWSLVKAHALSVVETCVQVGSQFQNVLSNAERWLPIGPLHDVVAVKMSSLLPSVAVTPASTWAVSKNAAWHRYYSAQRELFPELGIGLWLQVPNAAEAERNLFFCVLVQVVSCATG